MTTVRNSHCVKSCQWCEQYYDISLSDAATDGKFCSQECENDHNYEHPPKMTQGQQADAYYERESA